MFRGPPPGRNLIAAVESPLSSPGSHGSTVTDGFYATADLFQPETSCDDESGGDYLEDVILPSRLEKLHRLATGSFLGEVHVYKII